MGTPETSVHAGTCGKGRPAPSSGRFSLALSSPQVPGLPGPGVLHWGCAESSILACDLGLGWGACYSSEGWCSPTAGPTGWAAGAPVVSAGRSLPITRALGSEAPPSLSLCRESIRFCFPTRLVGGEGWQPGEEPPLPFTLEGLASSVGGPGPRGLDQLSSRTSVPAGLH